ncbi:hypothetical protein FKM82_014400 [Ascaphus truei]
MARICGLYTHLSAPVAGTPPLRTAPHPAPTTQDGPSSVEIVVYNKMRKEFCLMPREVTAILSWKCEPRGKPDTRVASRRGMSFQGASTSSGFRKHHRCLGLQWTWRSTANTAITTATVTEFEIYLIHAYYHPALGWPSLGSSV